MEQQQQQQHHCQSCDAHWNSSEVLLHTCQSLTEEQQGSAHHASLSQSEFGTSESTGHQEAVTDTECLRGWAHYLLGGPSVQLSRMNYSLARCLNHLLDRLHFVELVGTGVLKQSRRSFKFKGKFYEK